MKYRHPHVRVHNAEADRLTKIQREERGSVSARTVEGKPTRIMGPYVPTPERESRAGQIIDLRREAAKLEYPIGKGA